LKLVPFDKAQLRLGEPLPFGLRDETGRLLLGAGSDLRGAEQLEALLAQRLFADEHEAADWHRRLAAAMDEKLRQNAPLREVAAVRPGRGVREPAAAAQATFGEQWEDVVQLLDGALRDVAAGGDWLARFEEAHARARALVVRRPDASLYLLVYGAGHSIEKYSSHHALLTMLICELAAPLLGWPAGALDSLGRAALGMNAAMLRLQDHLASTHRPPNAEMRAEIQDHPEAGAALLGRGGLDDRLALDVVRLHHDASGLEQPLATLPPARQLARLLRRVDIFCAKISRRASRAPMSPVRAAREACLGPGGVPDEIGGALLRAVGLYPPGSFVELASGEVGIVVARGRRANLPYVASLVAASGSPLGEPTLRDTLEQRFAVRSAVAPVQVRVRPPHERLLAMR
jgi:HD-GYP domain-containing protein (c-di-GMP phosphodiesterase class II)